MYYRCHAAVAAVGIVGVDYVDDAAAVADDVEHRVAVAVPVAAAAYFVDAAAADAAAASIAADAVRADEASISLQTSASN